MFGLIWWVIVGLIAGWLTGKIMSGGGYGPIMDIVVGILGALLGGFVMSHLGFAGSGGLIYNIIVAVIGAVILTLVDLPRTIPATSTLRRCQARWTAPRHWTATWPKRKRR